MKRTVNEVLQNLIDLDFDKKAYVVHSQYKWDSTSGEKCPACKGRGKFMHGKSEYTCSDCQGYGTLGEYKDMFIVSCIRPNQEYFTIRDGRPQLGMYSDIRGIFNTKKKAFDLAKELNKEK